jgi:hypothetical protein
MVSLAFGDAIAKVCKYVYLAAFDALAVCARGAIGEDPLALDVDALSVPSRTTLFTRESGWLKVRRSGKGKI